MTKIYEKLQNSYCTPLEFFVVGSFDIWHTKSHGHRNYLHGFYLATLIQKCEGKIITHMHNLEMLFQEKGQDHPLIKV